ncbi:metallophosphoesterase family protein [Bacillus nakamurai]|uniref:metallophosphoesterase family protein n=1 Tax=Bacillus nakamurai TaxID=1793963 RepID=UPI001E50DB4C|nr:DNA repair exonuclease [Bacillus nakamurai]MCC9022577.1 DNA repair exonuclease [Bacillus nakamurai]
MADLTFIHAADLHLDSPFYGISHLPEPVYARIKESTFHSVSRLIDDAFREKADFVLLSGDLFDEANRSLKAQLFLRKQFTRLQEAEIQVFVIFGNHDHLGGDWTPIEWPGNVHIFTSDTPEEKSYFKNGKLAASIYGCSYPERIVTVNQASRYRKATGAPFHIGMLHGTLSGAEGHDPYCPFTKEDLEKSGMDYWALGHIHKRQVLSPRHPAAIYPGNIQARHLKETGPKGYYLVQVTNGDISYEFKQAHDILWEEIELDISGAEQMTSLMKTASAAFAGFRAAGRPACVKLVLCGESPRFWTEAPSGITEEFLSALQEEEAEEECFVWPLAIEDRTDQKASGELLDPFFGGLLQDIEQCADMNEVFEALERHPVYRRQMPSFADEDIQDIKRQAQTVLKRQLKEIGT